MNDLHIDTASNKEIKVGLKVDNQEFSMTRKIGTQKSQVVLSLIDELLKKHNVSITTIKSIKVNIGPGSFTGLRVGISVANALGWTLGIPVNGKKNLAQPQYR